MLSGAALDLAFALRGKVGGLSQGDGSTLADLRATSGLPEGAFDRALVELEGIGFVRVDRTLSAEPAVLVLAPLQIYLDDLESQGTDDL